VDNLASVRVLTEITIIYANQFCKCWDNWPWTLHRFAENCMRFI